MIDGYSCEIDANRKRAEAERRAARERLILSHGTGAWTSAARGVESRTRGVLPRRGRPSIVTALIRLRTAVLT